MSVGGGRWRRWLRLAHRDLGYFVVGGFLIYSVSGFLLSMRGLGVDLLSTEARVSHRLGPGLSAEGLSAAWDARRGALPPLREVEVVSEGFTARVGRGRVTYNAATGHLEGRVRGVRPWMRLVNRMHFNGQGQWRVLGVFFAVSLAFLTLSGALLVRGRNGFARRGVWFALGGVVCVVLFALL